MTRTARQKLSRSLAERINVYAQARVYVSRTRFDVAIRFRTASADLGLHLLMFIFRECSLVPVGQNEQRRAFLFDLCLCDASMTNSMAWTMNKNILSRDFACSLLLCIVHCYS